MAAHNIIQALVFGEILFDVYQDGTHLGGAPLNFAWYLRQFGVNTGMISAVGDDLLGAQVRSMLRRAEIDQTLVAHADAPTGTVDVRLIDGQPRYIINENVAWDQISDCPDRMQQPEMFYFGTLAQRSECNRSTLRAWLQQAVKQHFFDINLRQSFYNEAIVRTGLEHSSIVKMNDDEWQVLSAMFKLTEPATMVQDYDLQALIVTHGEHGASLYRKHSHYDVPSPQVKVIDAVGAGDAFSATIAVAAIRGVELEQALPIACEVGAYVVTVRGAQTTLPAHLTSAFKRENT